MSSVPIRERFVDNGKAHWDGPDLRKLSILPSVFSFEKGQRKELGTYTPPSNFFKT